MIKLIVSDVDGTLIQDGTFRLPPETFPMIERCHTKGIKFAVASGRQYSSLKQMFAPVWEDIYFMPENGNITLYQDQVRHSVALPSGLVQELIADIRSNADCPFAICTPYTMYLYQTPPWFAGFMLEDVGNTITYLQDLSFLNYEKVVKISLYAPLERIGELEAHFETR